MKSANSQFWHAHTFAVSFREDFLSGISDIRGTMPQYPPVQLERTWWMPVPHLKCQGKQLPPYFLLNQQALFKGCTEVLSDSSVISDAAVSRFFDLSPKHAECRGMGYTQARRSPSSSIRRISSNLDVEPSVEQIPAMEGDSPSDKATTHMRWY